MVQCVFCNGSAATALGNVLASRTSLCTDSETSMCQLHRCTGQGIAIHAPSAVEVMRLGGEAINEVYCSFPETLEEVKGERFLRGRKWEVMLSPQFNSVT